MAKVKKIKLNEMPKDAQIAVKEYQKQISNKKQELREKMESNAELQRNRSMSKEQRGRQAIDLMTKRQKEYLSSKLGREVSHSEAEAAARKIAKQYHGSDY